MFFSSIFSVFLSFLSSNIALKLESARQLLRYGFFKYLWFFFREISNLISNFLFFFKFNFKFPEKKQKFPWVGVHFSILSLSSFKAQPWNRDRSTIPMVSVLGLCVFVWSRTCLVVRFLSVLVFETCSECLLRAEWCSGDLDKTDWRLDGNLRFHLEFPD